MRLAYYDVPNLQDAGAGAGNRQSSPLFLDVRKGSRAATARRCPAVKPRPQCLPVRRKLVKDQKREDSDAD